MRSIRKVSMGITLLSLMTATVLAQNATEARSSSPTGPQPPGKTHPQRPLTYGTTAISYLEVPANAFLPHNSSTQGYQSLDFGRGARWPTTAVHDLVAPIHLPAGALVVYLELDGFDNNAGAAVFGSFTACNYYASGCTYHPTAGASIGGDCTVPGFICSGVAAMNTGGDLIDINLSAEGIVIDNFFGEYSLLAEPTANDGSVAVGGMIVGYVLQVSPAPVTPTFLDVPVSDAAFQYIEAFVAAGITVGCGSGNYCPDDPVTRRQMAVFFAKALGLQFN